MLAIAVSTSSCYTLEQAYQQNNLFNSRRPIDEVLMKGDFADDLRGKLSEVQKILAFAGGQGLRSDGAYRYYIHTDQPVVSYLVQAAEPYALEAKTWWFPIVGAVPYLGFFDKHDRDAKAHELRQQGYDVHVSGVGAFSSLGWFEDPIYTSMLRRDRAELAHLLFHELTHRTFWSRGSVRFNENLAEYVAEQLTEAYLKDQPGGAQEIDAYVARRRDRSKFKEWLKELRAALDELYNKPPEGEAAFRSAKEAIFLRYTEGDERPSEPSVRGFLRGSWNNARVLATSLYAPETERFAKAHACVDESLSIPTLFEALARVQGDFDDQFAALDALCK